MSTDVEWTHGIEQYISASCMENDRKNLGIGGRNDGSVPSPGHPSIHL